MIVLLLKSCHHQLLVSQNLGVSLLDLAFFEDESLVNSFDRGIEEDLHVVEDAHGPVSIEAGLELDEVLLVGLLFVYLLKR